MPNQSNDLSPIQAQARQSRGLDKLAKQLIRDYGVEGAKRICHEYCWDGVSRAIEASAADNAAR